MNRYWRRFPAQLADYTNHCVNLSVTDAQGRPIDSTWHGGVLRVNSILDLKIRIENVGPLDMADVSVMLIAQGGYVQLEGPTGNTWSKIHSVRIGALASGNTSFAAARMRGLKATPSTDGHALVSATLYWEARFASGELRSDARVVAAPAAPAAPMAFIIA